IYQNRAQDVELTRNLSGAPRATREKGLDPECDFLRAPDEFVGLVSGDWPTANREGASVDQRVASVAKIAEGLPQHRLFLQTSPGECAEQNVIFLLHARFLLVVVPVVDVMPQLSGRMVRRR